MAGQNKTGLSPQILQPTARPHDTFAQTNGGASLFQLADGLARFAPSLARYGSVLADEKSAKDQQAGENAAREFAQAGSTYKDAIAKGLIKPHQSPFFRLGAYETFGRASARRYAADFTVALSQSAVAESTNPSDFDKFEGDYRKQWQTEHLGEEVDPYMANAFGKQADDKVEEARHNFAASAGARLVKQTGEAFHAEVFSIVEDGWKAGFDERDVLTLVNQAFKRQEAVGMDRGVLNQLMSNAIDSAAKSVGDSDLLNIKRKIKLGGGTLAGTTYGAAGSEAAENEIAVVNQSRLRSQREELAAQRQAAVDSIESDLVTALQASKSPLTLDISPFVDKIVKAGEPDKATSLLGIQKAFADKEYQDIPSVRQRLTIGVYDGTTTRARLNQALDAKSITFATYNALSDDIKARDKQGQEGAALKTATLEKVRSRFYRLFAAEYGASTLEERYRAENAASEGVANWIGYKKGEGATATQEQDEEWLHKQVHRQFEMKGDPSTTKRLLTQPDKFPDADFTKPAQVNPKKAPVAPPSTFKLIEEDYARVQAGGKWSREAYAALVSLGVQPKDVKEWLTQQKKFIP